MDKVLFKKWLTNLKNHYPDEVTSQAVERIIQLVDELPQEGQSEATSLVMHVPKEIEGDMFALALFSDGACRGNPGPGSWAHLVQSSTGDILLESSGVEIPTTNNKMELTGVIEGLKRLSDKKEFRIEVFTDSKYVVEGMKSWVSGWKKRGWLKADNKPPENLELWKELDALTLGFSIVHFNWVKGHAGHPQNERCDQLANLALNQAGF